ncbi:hypothetical protein EMIHUDRAFT_211259 [Emiliania huxleyi CCMP1516]|uniref:Guanylyl cyclase n=2 Tax=Emiliania huxleyi TaxID=2903 RepID=A0A0D3IWQ2_EMIH1|nr:hypothetical protein EMIHUDRAFT_211259 [Emiliania huxleyi CCMP1516]EOD15687.1 hypothetical protein EMIHUDRAFT_211259 [Emiliania huxleyi CCMP1516]|eukprot:XP_005768116.1 hypothetical protein EMIHUDRAFT_211259 [Emiliania huxleyi CCMP1516]
MCPSPAAASLRRVPHVRQSFSWDCGFACTEMALRALGVPARECHVSQLRKRVPSSSIWTVDLAFILREFGLRFRFLTATLGVDPSYSAEAFYRPTLERDAERVNTLFGRAGAADIAIEQRSISPSELRVLCGGAHTCGGNLIIGLERALVPAEDLDAARRSHGTDEDLLIIPWDQPCLVTPPPPPGEAAEEAAGERVAE